MGLEELKAPGRAMKAKDPETQGAELEARDALSLLSDVPKTLESHP